MLSFHLLHKTGPALVDEIPLKLGYNNLLATRASWGPSYVISFDLFLTSSSNGNIMRFTRGGEAGVGNRVPRMGYNDNEIRIWNNYDHDEDQRYIFEDPDQTWIGKWIEILITQTIYKVRRTKGRCFKLYTYRFNIS